MIFCILLLKVNNNTHFSSIIRALINLNYLFYIGEEFNYCAILDDYELGKTLGVGGFGKVVLGKHREKKAEVAIKFTDVGD